MFWLLTSLIFLFLYALLIIFYWSTWAKLNDYSLSSETVVKFISVVIPARNEEKNLPGLLKALSRQTYSQDKFEIIVVDDYSKDATTEIVQNFPLSNLALLKPEADPKYSSKKKAIETAIEYAKGEIIVTTDADCIPQKKWLEIINDCFLRDAVFVAAPVKIFYDKSFLQLFQSLDFLTLQGITAASVSSGFHMMCNGANLAYTKQAFHMVNGFEGIDKVATGDDMLLMHKIWKRYPEKVVYLKSKEVIMETQPMQSWKDFYMQRKRWASKTLIYDDYKIISILVFVFLLNCLFVALVIASFFNISYWWYVLAFWLAKALIEFPFVYSVSKFYNEQKLVKYLFLFQPLHIFYTVFVGLASQFGKYEWKGRRTK